MKNGDQKAQCSFFWKQVLKRQRESELQARSSQVCPQKTGCLDSKDAAVKCKSGRFARESNVHEGSQTWTARVHRRSATLTSSYPTQKKNKTGSSVRPKIIKVVDYFRRLHREEPRHQAESLMSICSSCQ